MVWWRKAERALEAAEHGHFIEMVLEALFGWRAWLVGIASGVVMLFIAAADPKHWSVTEVIFYALGTAAIVMVIAAAFAVLWQLLRGSASKWGRAQAEAAFEFVYDPNDDRFFKRDDRKDIYRVGLHILASQTIDFPNVRAIDSPFTERVIRPRHDNKPHPIGAVQIYMGGALDPECLELVDLCDLPPHRKYLRIENEKDPLAHVQTFTLEARGRNVRPVTATFEYDPERLPMIRKIS